MNKTIYLSTILLTIFSIHAAEEWSHDQTAALAMYEIYETKANPSIEENSISAIGKSEITIFNRKKVNFSATNDKLNLRLKLPAGQRSIHCYFKTDKDTEFSEDRKLSLFFTSKGEWQNVEADCSKNVNWQGNITGIRFDFQLASGEKVLWKNVKFYSKHEMPTQWNFALETTDVWNWQKSLAAAAQKSNGAMKLDFVKPYSDGPLIRTYIDHRKFTTMLIRARASSQGNFNAVLYFQTEKNDTLSEKQKIIFQMSLSDEYKEFRVPVAKNQMWNSTVTGFRLDVCAPHVPCSLEISDIIFSDDKNLAGLNNFGKTFGPYMDLPPGRDYIFSCNTSLPTSGSVRIEDPFGNIIREIPLTLPENKFQTVFNLPGNGACVLFSFNSAISNMRIEPIPSGTEENWTAQWIADRKNFKAKGSQFFQKELFLVEKPVDCRFQGSADDRMDLYINGKKVILPEATWMNPRTADVTDFFQKGSNLIAFHLENNGEASGLLANFAIQTADNRLLKVDTNETFRTLRNPTDDWKTRLYPSEESFAPLVVGPYNVSPWGDWCLMQYEKFSIREQFSAKNTSLSPIKGGVRLQTDLHAVSLNSPRNHITVRALADNVIIAEENIKFTVPMGKNGDTRRIEQDIFAGKLLSGNYVLQLSGSDTHTTTDKELRFTVTESPDMKANTVSEIRQTVNGPVIFINGTPFCDMIFTSKVIESIREHYNMGYRIFIVSAGTNVGKGLTTPGWNQHGYDFAIVMRNLNRITAAFPDIKFILTFGIDAPYWWHKKYPDQCIYLEGKTEHENLASPASKQWRKDAKKFIKTFIRQMENSPLRHHIIGYRLASLCDGGEWIYPGVWANPRLHADFSVAMRDYFREFLKNKYGKNLDVSHINVPSGKERQLPSKSAFRDPVKEQHIIDYIECQSDAVATAAIEFLQAAKEEAKNKIVGIYGGYLLFLTDYTVQNVGHLAFRKIYLSKAADFFSGPIDYHLRKLGLPGGNMASISSLKLHGATYFQENDTRTFLNDSPSHRHVNNLFESASVLLRDSAIGLVTSTPIYTCDLTGNSYRNQGLIDTGALLQKCFKANFNRERKAKPQVALLYSIDSLPYLIEKNQEITNASSYLLRINTGKSGVLTDAYLLEDIQMDSFPADQYKCFVIINGFYLKPAIRAAIENKLCKNGTTVVFTPGAGIIHKQKLSKENMEEITGFAMTESSDPIPFKPHNLDNGKNYVIRQYSDHRRIYLASTELTPALYRQIFSEAGAHVWIKSSDTLNTNGTTAFIHADSAGEKTVYLPFKAKVTDLTSDRVIPTSDNGKKFKIKLKKYETRLFKFEQL